MKISKEEFGLWKQHEVTKNLYSALKTIRLQIEQDMLDDNVILSDKGHVTLARLSGIREGLSIILNLTAEDVDDDEEQTN